MQSETFPADSRQEKAPATYEGIIEAARRMRESKVQGDPLDPESSQFEVVQRAIETCRTERGLHMRGVGSVEKAEDIVRWSRIWIDAGYRTPKFIRAAIEQLTDEHADALAEGNAEVTRVLADALSALESGLADKKEKVPAIAQQKITEALRLAEEGKTTDAVGLLTLAMFDPRIKRLPQNIRDGIVSLRDKIKAGAAT